jgi:hypothetical protein
MYPPSSGTLPGIFTVGKVHKTIIATGHNSDEFKTFLKQHFSAIDIDFCFDDIDELRKEDNLKGVKAFCRKEQSQIFTQIMKDLKIASQTKPVIVFGLNNQLELIKNVKQAVSC